jgi:two-component system NtrC family sensor kinase
MGRPEAEGLREIEKVFLARPRVSIRLRIVAGFLLCFFLLAITGLVNLVILYQARSKLRFLDVSQSLSLQIQRASHLAGLDFPNATHLATAATNAQDAFNLFLKESANVMGATSEEDLARLDYRMGHYVQLLDDGLAQAKAGGASPAAQKALQQEIQAGASDILDMLRTMKAREAATADRVLSLSQKLPFLFSAVMLAIIFWITSLLAGTITASLRRLEDSTRHIAAGDFLLMNPVRRYHDEFSDLALAVNRMMTELRAREAQVARADRLASIGLLASAFAHSVGATLDALREHATSLRAACRDEDAPELLRLSQAISSEAARGRRTVGTLLEFALDDASLLAEVSLVEIVQSARQLLQAQMDESHVTFLDEIPPELPVVRGAPNQLRHVFVDLFQNAIQAMPRGGTLSVKAALLDDRHAGVTVSDSGSGISAEDLPHIFEPSFTTRASQGGTGLGLSITYSLIKRHGGEVRAESLVGRGTTIRLTLPLA